MIEGKTLGPSADIYSLGCVLCECMTGAPPFRKESEFAVLWAHVNEPPPRLSAHRPELGPELDRVLARALAKVPEERYESAGGLVEAARQGLPVPAPPPKGSRRRLPLAAAAVLTVALAVALPLALTEGKRAARALPTTVIATDSTQRIDPRSNRLVATIPVGPSTGQTGYQLAAAGGAIWVVNGDRNRLYRIDPGENSATAFPGNGAPLGIASGGGFLWVSNRDDGIISQIDPHTGATLHTIPLPPGFVDGPIAASPDAVIVSENNGSRLVRIDRLSLAPHSRGARLWSLVWGERAFWTTTGYGDRARLVRLDGRGVARIRGANFVPALAVGDDAVWAAVTDEKDGLGLLIRFDPRTLRETGRVNVGGFPTEIAFAEGSVWVADDYAGTVSRVDARTLKVVARTPVGPHPSDVVVGADGIWVAVHPTSG